MAKKALEGLTESMLYILMALHDGPKCGIEAAAFAERRSGGRVRLGPATLYTVLGRFEQENYIRETAVDGRRRTYAITARGEQAYEAELRRLRRCLADAEARELPAALPQHA